MSDGAVYRVRIAVVTTHPIQYYAPLFKCMANEPDMELKVFYTWSQSQRGANYDRDFGKTIAWDIPLLDGYQYEFVENAAKNPGIHHFNGLVNPGLREKISAWKPDCLLVLGWNFNSHLGSMRYFRGKIPVLFKGDSTLLDEQAGIKKILRRIFLKWVYSHADYALYAGKRNYDYFYRHGMKEKQLSRMPHAVDNSRFHGMEDLEVKAKQWRKELGIGEDDLVILFAGKLEPKKDPGFMLRLAEHLPDPRLKLILVGNGKLENELKKQALNDKRIIFLEFQNQEKMPVLYRLGDIFVLPSRGPGETWGLAVNEAMACNRPVIVSSKCGCAPDLVEEGRTGWVFEPGDAGDRKISNLLGKILDDRSILYGMGDQAWKKLESFSYPVVIESMRQLLGEIGLAKTRDQ
jgi:glycosyltransferase involved in cell wall biosynthesis